MMSRFFSSAEQAAGVLRARARAAFMATRARIGALLPDRPRRYRAEGVEQAPDAARIFAPVARGFDGDQDAPDRTGTSLRFELTRSAGDIVNRQATLSGKADALVRAIGERLDGETTLAAQGLRFLIAAGWALLAFTLLWISRGGDAPWAPFIGPLSGAEAAALARAFAILAGAGFLVVFTVSAIVFALGKGNNNALRRRSADLGREAGALAREFDDELSRLRRAMDERKDPAAAVTELSRAHLTALEAAVFFRRLQFLTDPDRYEASLKFRGFLRMGGGGAGGSTGEGFLLGFLTGVFVMALWTPVPIELPVEIPDFTGSKDWAEAAILFGAFFFAIAGLLVSTLRGVVTAGAERQARDEALDAVRSGFVSTNAPLIESVVQRIEDALDVFQARLAARVKAAHDAAANYEETPAWRRAPEGPRHVETAFQAAPKPFLASGDTKGPKEARRRAARPNPLIPGAE